MAFEYKCVGGPERPRRLRGVSRSERVAFAMEAIIRAEAVDGWEYLRTDLVPVEEKPGLFSRMREVHLAVLVFRRESGAARGRGPGAEPAPPFEVEPVDEREARIRLSAERDAPPSRTNRPPTGLG